MFSRKAKTLSVRVYRIKFQAALTPRAGSFFSHRGNLRTKLVASRSTRRRARSSTCLGSASVIHLTATALGGIANARGCIRSLRNASKARGMHRRDDDVDLSRLAPFCHARASSDTFARNKKTAAALLRVLTRTPPRPSASKAIDDSW